MADRVGQQFGNYRLVRLLGTGAFAEVYLGEHIHLGSRAAIKVLHAHLANDEEVQNFSVEARTIVDLVHLHIVRLLDFGIESGTPFLVMDYAPNGTLRQRHPRGAVLPPAIVLPYVKQVADALAYAHEKKLVHRDIKPENLLLGRNDEVLVSDFGIAVIASTRYDGPQNVAGTVSYMAPEQLQGRPQRASDQYALGIMSYEWLTGSVPFHGNWLEVASQHSLIPPPPLRKKVPGLSPAIEEAVLTALAKDARERFASVRDFAGALEQASLGALPDLAPSTPPSTVFSSPLPTGLLFAPTRIERPSSQDGPDAGEHKLATAAPIPPTVREVSPTLLTVTADAPSPAVPKKKRRWLLKTALTSLTLLLLGSIVLGALGFMGRGPLAPLTSRATQPKSTVKQPTATANQPTATATPRPMAGVITEFSLSRGAEPNDITIGPDGNLWFTEDNGNRIGRITPAGQIAEYPVPTPDSQPNAIIAGSDGNLWFTEPNGNKIGRITPDGQITEYLIPTPRSQTYWMIAGPDGNFWFTELGGDKIGRITPQGTITEYRIPTPFSTPTLITVGPDRNLWFTEQLGNKIGRITPQGTITEYTIRTPTTQEPSNQPVGIISGPDENLWFTEIGEYLNGEFVGGKIGRITPAGEITEFAPPTANSLPDVIISGPDGNVWFSEGNGDSIGRITLQGTITEYPLPTLDSMANSMVLGPDGNLWFTERSGDKIGRITSGV